MPDRSTYEPGMRIDYNPQSRTVTVTFRGRVKDLSGTFPSPEAARRAGESYCRCLGWNPKVPAVRVRSLMTPGRWPHPLS